MKTRQMNALFWAINCHELRMQQSLAYGESLRGASMALVMRRRFFSGLSEFLFASV